MADSNAADFIYARAKRHTVTTHEELVALVYRYRDGDERARDEIVTRNEKLVMQRVNLFGVHPSLDPEDLHQAGMLGLLRAARNFKPELGFKFSTYAARVIDQYISKEIKSKGRLVKLPPSIGAKLLRAQRAWSKYIKEHGEKPSQQQLSELADLSIEDLNTCKQFLMDPVSMDSYTNPMANDDSGGREMSMVDLLESTSLSPSEQAERAWDKEEVRKWLAALANPRDREFIQFRFGFGDNEAKTRMQLAQKYGLSELEVHRWEKKVLDQLLQLATRATINADFVNNDSRRPETERVAKAPSRARKPRRPGQNPIPSVQTACHSTELARA